MNNSLTHTKHKPAKSANELLNEKIKRAKTEFKKAEANFEIWRGYVQAHEKIHTEKIRPQVDIYLSTKRSWLIGLISVYDKYSWNELEDQVIFHQVLDALEELEPKFSNDPEISAISKRFAAAMGDEFAFFGDIEKDFNEMDQDDPFYEQAKSEFESFKKNKEDLDQRELEGFIKMAKNSFDCHDDDFKGCKNVEEAMERLKYLRYHRERAKHAESAASQNKNATPIETKELYRRLASLIHPDKETDPKIKAEKTVLMQRLNSAYRSNDIETLMSIQTELALENPVDLGNSEWGLNTILANIKKQTSQIKEKTKMFSDLMKQNAGVSRSNKPEDIHKKIQQVIQRQIKEISIQNKRLQKNLDKDFASKKKAKALVQDWIIESIDDFHNDFDDDYDDLFS